MPLTAVLLISVSVVLHSGWNIICKSKTPSGAFFLLLTITSVLLLSPVFLIWRNELLRMSWSFYALVALTGFAQTCYYVALGNAYRLTDVSIAYPLARSIPVVLTLLVTTVLGFGKVVTPVAVIGMNIIFIGCIILPHMRFRNILNIKVYLNWGFIFILGAAIGITAYTVIDKEALKIIDETGILDDGVYKKAIFFIALENLSITVFLLPYVLCRAVERQALRKLVEESPFAPSLAAVMCTFSYSLILAAMQYVDNVSYVVAFRQLSIPLGAAMGIAFLHEKFSWPKLTGLILILAGLILVSLF